MIVGHQGQTNLQATISAATSNNDIDSLIQPHHPIACHGNLYYDEDGVLSCDHVAAPQGNARTQAALNHSVAILLIEFASKL